MLEASSPAVDRALSWAVACSAGCLRFAVVSSEITRD